ncbi:unnamed protein product [Darwinula stevensoni]|uniref:1-alkyl-2-acetylglycerophosphocholine esterase n=1 Tax=Darwinula stevensoni TaxID=69355 RepID=A0A7R9A548_9CRUS|nr:unnamed protein product [Darwinula stevensoni]CAG0885682.1 unnamed protein product [Darwinula stevensoni]
MANGENGFVKPHLPLPEGPYMVSHVDVLKKGKGLDGLLLRLYYPTDEDSPDIFSAQEEWPHWLPEVNKYVEGYSAFVGVWPSVMHLIYRVCIGDFWIPMFHNRAPKKVSGGYPLVIFSHGLGMCRCSYSYICMQLASHGFLVAALDHRDGSSCMTAEAHDGSAENETAWIPYRTLEKGESELKLRNAQVHQRSEEVRNVLRFMEELNSGNLDFSSLSLPSDISTLKQIQGEINMEKVVVSGHSFGGATTLVSLTKEPKFRCLEIIAYDTDWIQSDSEPSLNVPFIEDGPTDEIMGDIEGKEAGRKSVPYWMPRGRVRGIVGAGIALDSWMYPLQKEEEILRSIQKPVLFINMEAFQTNANLRAMKKCLNGACTKKVVTIQGTVHHNQVDTPFMSNVAWYSRLASHLIIGPNSKTDHDVAARLNVALMLEFLWRLLGLEPREKELKMVQEHKELLLEGIDQ